MISSILKPKSFVAILVFCFAAYFSGISQLSGTYTIGGVTPDYLTVGDAVNDLTTLGVSGPVTFELADGTYPEQTVITNIAGTSPTNTVLFKSASGDSTAVILNYDPIGAGDNFVLRLSDCDYLEFRQITIASLDPIFGNVVSLMDTASNLIFSGCVFQTGDNAAALLSSDPLSNSNNLQISNCLFSGGYQGLFLSGFSSGDREEGLQVLDNEFAEQEGFVIDIARNTSPTITGNYIHSNSFNNNNSSALLFNNVFDGPSSAQDVSHNFIKIHHGTGLRITYSNGDPVEPSFSNNWIWVRGDTNFLRNTCLLLVNGGQQKFYNNTFVVMDSGGLNSKTVMTEDWPGTGGGNELVNNILVNISGGYSIGLEDTTVLSTIDFNDHFSLPGKMGRRAGTDYADLNSWQAGTGFDASSVKADPMFYDWENDFHICNPTLNGIGMTGLAVTEDYDREPRNPLSPDIGADEFDPLTSVFLGDDTLFCQGNSLELSVDTFLNASYLWSTGAMTQSITVSDSDSYWVAIYSQCDTIYDTIHVDVDVCTSLDPDARISLFNVYPNPAFSRIFVEPGKEWKGNKVYWELKDLYGKTIAENKLLNAGKFEIDLEDFSPGTYFIQVSNGIDNQVRKLLVLGN